MDGEQSSRNMDGFGRPGRGWKLFSLAAVCLAVSVPVLMGVRPISINEDLGYHLALGDEFLATGKISDTSPYVFMNDPTKRYPPGPGGWYDDQGRYHFVMASWISQVIMSLVNRAAGFDGLCILSLLLIVGIVLQLLVLMRWLGLPQVFQAAAMLMIAVTAYERFNLRPELFGYNLFILQLLILVYALGLAGEPKKAISWRALLAIVGIQLVFENVHANSSLGFGPSMAFLVDATLRYFWRRFFRRGEKEALAVARSNFIRLGLMLVLQIGVCFVNPWPVRLAVLLPYEQLAVFRQLKDAGFVYSPSGHPWTAIGEHFPPFKMDAFGNATSTYALMGVLGLAGIGMICSLIGRQWRILFLLAGMAAATISLRRQIAVGAFILAPVGLYAIWLAFVYLARRFGLPDLTKVSLVCMCVLAALSVGLAWSVITSRFYYWDDLGFRFGLGTSRAMMPMGTVEWINKHQPADRIWSDFNISSSVYYLTKPHRDVPIITNGWAYPPAIMNKFLNYTQGFIPFDQAVADYNLNAVAMHMYTATMKLSRELRLDPKWTVVFIDAQDVIFLRNNGPNAGLARQYGITEETFDADEYIKRIQTEDQFPDYIMRTGTATLYNLGWYSAAIEVGEETLKISPPRADTWHVVGACYATRGTRRLLEGAMKQQKDRLAAGDCFSKGRQDLQRARECFKKALEINPDFKDAVNDLKFLDSQISALEKGLPTLVPSNFDYFPPGFAFLPQPPSGQTNQK